LFVEQNFKASQPLRRIFSQARSGGCMTLIIEDVRPEGPVADENAEIAGLFSDHVMAGLRRLSFWKKVVRSTDEIASLTDADCFGYALVKHDVCPTRKSDKWHVFEAAISKYDHGHNYSPCAKPVSFLVGSKQFQVTAILYCQQNGLNKACAQVSLRSLCAPYLGNLELTYRQINDLAFEGVATRAPWEGLRAYQIPKVLNGLGIPYFEFDYQSPTATKLRDSFPYQRIVYSGIEACAGALVAFTMSGPTAGVDGHMIPFFGHTFNEDSWVPNADNEYFNVGTAIRYLPSDLWLSSFIVHDDNFGSNLCIPKAYLRRDLAQYVVALLPMGYVYNGLFAEVAASDYFYSMLAQIATGASANVWINRLVSFALGRRLVLRLVPITREGYLEHLQAAEDWDRNREDSTTLSHLRSIKMSLMWMIELSVPDLFAINKRKIGEILLDATIAFSPKVDFKTFILARLPGSYYFFDALDSNGQPTFATVKSNFISHTELLVR
jgi:hypothetical protein